MELSSLAGNRALKTQLSQQEEGRGLSHAYILSGPAGSGKHTLARLLCGAMLCTASVERRPCGHCGPCKKVFSGIHPDVAVISGPAQGKPITVDQVRQLRADAYIRPNEGERKVYLLEGADRMNASAQNAMLKLLEEGPAYAAFLLLAENGGGVLQTVRSRCEELSLTPVPPGEAEEWLRARFPDRPADQLRRAAQEAQGILGRAVSLLEGDGGQAQERRAQADTLVRALEGTDELALFEASLLLEKAPKEELPRLLDQLYLQLGERLAVSGEKSRLLKAAALVRKLRGAAELNANPGQLSGWLCAGMFLENEKGRMQNAE